MGNWSNLDTGGTSDRKSMFVKFEDGKPVRGVLAGEPIEYYHTWPDGKTSKRFRTNFLVEEDGKYVPKILEVGVSVVKQLKFLQENGYDFDRTAFVITRSGKGLNTEYTVLAPPNGFLKEDIVERLKSIKLLDLTLKPKKKDNHEGTPNFNEFGN